ncbi:ABC transporter substrate-binding protein [Peribacillus simplex]|uniref:ABC transporter substrate-binding protein n=1 Tax=Peribacillus simplex TaxID=1478 RepID=UPI001DCA7B78|nr:ABC transporter substrate-binding protein [Peribacillus simplex]MED4094480.1 ABC transporter substrate-binding protein [Peribacillus simplex]CAH0319337.1 Periplasmic dipeptide transport protein [Peribacillus simplex]
MRKILFLFVAVLLIVTGCSQSNESSSSTSKSESDGKKIVRIGWQNSGFPSPFTFDTNGPGGFLRNSFLFDTLTWKDDTGVIPWLASSWKVSEDNLEYTFTLEKDVTFHDGESLTADDVVFSYNYFKENTFQWNADMTKVASAEKVSDDEVKITLAEPYVPFISEIAGKLPIIPEHIWSDVEQPLEYQEDEALIGSGPFTLDSYDSATGNYKFAKNENYFKGDVTVDEVQYLATENRMLSLQNKEIDGGMTFNYTEVQQLKELGYDVLKSEPTGSAVRIVFNLENEQLSDKNLRQAIAYALNRTSIAEKLTGNSEVMVGSAGVIPPDSTWYKEDVKQYDYNVEQANAILDKLGYEKNDADVREDLDLSVLVSSTSQEAELMKSMLADVGIELDIQTVDSATFSTAMAEGKYDMTITGHIGLSGDPDFLRLWFSGQASNSLAGKGVFDNEEFQELASLQLKQGKEAERKATVDEMQDTLAEELPTLVLYHRPFYYVYDSSVFAGWFNTYGGIADGIPLTDNKAVFVDYK